MPGQFAVSSTSKGQVATGKVESSGPAEDRVLEAIEEREDLFPHWITKVDGRGLYTSTLVEELNLVYTPRQVEVHEKAPWSRSGFVWPPQRAYVNHVALLVVRGPNRPVCVTAGHIGNVLSEIVDSVNHQGGARTTGLRLIGNGAASHVGLKSYAIHGDILLEGFAKAELKNIGSRGFIFSIVGRPGARTKVAEFGIAGRGNIYLENVDVGDLWIEHGWEGKLHLKNTSVRAYRGPATEGEPISMHEEGGQLHFSPPSSGPVVP